MNTSKTAIFEAARYFVTNWAIEPREGFIANELSARVTALVEVSIEGRGRGQGVAIVRYKGEVVAHEFSGTFIEGEWVELLMAQYEINKRLDGKVAGIPMWEALNQNAQASTPLPCGMAGRLCDGCASVGNSAYCVDVQSQNAPETVRWNNEQYATEAKAAGGVLVIKAITQ